MTAARASLGHQGRPDSPARQLRRITLDVSAPRRKHGHPARHRRHQRHQAVELHTVVAIVGQVDLAAVLVTCPASVLFRSRVRVRPASSERTSGKPRGPDAADGPDALFPLPGQRCPCPAPAVGLCRSLCSICLSKGKGASGSSAASGMQFRPSSFAHAKVVRDRPGSSVSPSRGAWSRSAASAAAERHGLVRQAGGCTNVHQIGAGRGTRPAAVVRNSRRDAAWSRSATSASAGNSPQH